MNSPLTDIVTSSTNAVVDAARRAIFGVNPEPGLKILQSLLSKSRLPIAETLRLGLHRNWLPEEMQQLERLLLESLNRSDLKPAFDSLALVVERHRLYTGFASRFPRSMQRLRLERNPFGKDVAQAEQTIGRVRDVVAQLSSPFVSGSAQVPPPPRSLLALACLSAIARFHLLDSTLLVALLEALGNREKHLLALRDQTGCIVLSVAWGNQAQAERRLYFPDRLTGELLAMVSEDEVRAFLAGASRHASSSQVNRKTVYRLLQEATDELLCFSDRQNPALTLRSAMQAARILIYLEVPAAVAAFRSRKSISHAPPQSTLRRIVFGDRLNTGEIPASSDRSSGDKVRAPGRDRAAVEPQWLTGLRSAFRNDSRKQVIADLSAIASQQRSPGPCLAGFALLLLQGRKLSASSTKRFSLLIATRLGLRLGDADPGTLDIDTLEQLYGAVLADDDTDRVSDETSDQQLLHTKRTTMRALALFHRYLELTSSMVPLRSLKDRLNFRGLLPVDGNFITVDEYHLVLRFLGRQRSLNDPYLRSALKLLFSVLFWCGLRRSEALLLRVSDLDAAGHLHVRPYAQRKLKTRSSTRSLPAALLMPQEVFTDLAQWAGERARAPKAGVEALLFSIRDNVSKPLDPDFVFPKLAGGMREALGDPTLKLHHLRHSFATLLAAKLLPDTQAFASTFLKRHPATVDWLTNEESRKNFRVRLYGTDRIQSLDLQAIAHLLGHSSPATTVEHYIHCLDWVGALESSRHNSRKQPRQRR